MHDPTFSLQECIRLQVEKESWYEWAKSEVAQDERAMKVQIITKEKWKLAPRTAFKSLVSVMHV